MNLSIGQNIKRLRLAASMTQEQLAQELGLTAQAVSKWENGTTAPDIALLPELSVLLGVSIDALFSLSDEDRFERVENMCENLRFIPQRDFEQTERMLLDSRNDPATKPRATLLLARLYNKRADEFHTLAAPLAREALRLDPGNKAAHNAIFDAENGVYQDWNFTNHHRLIDFYISVVAQHPEDRRNYYWLLDLLIADGRTAEAREYVEKLRKVADTYHVELYMANICRAECDLPAALDWLERMKAHAPDAWQVWEEYADQMARLCRYDEALAAYEKARPLRPEKPFIDCEEAMAHIYELQGRIDKAIEMQETILTMLRDAWSITEGESIDAHKREIARLREKMA